MGAFLDSVVSDLAKKVEPDAVHDASPGSGVFDYDLSEFPLFRFQTNREQKRDESPIVYADTIAGEGGSPVRREWKVYPGPFGFGGPSTQATLFDLIQLYNEQGGQGSQVHFGSLRALCLRRSSRNPSKRDYLRVRRDIDILRGYDFHCKNAFYDKRRKRYADMNWRLFGSVFYFKSNPDIDADDLPAGFLELSPVFQRIVRERGFFPIGFGREFFHGLKPLEQRLALYLSKTFLSQSIHRRFEADIARILPVLAARQQDVRLAVERAARGLLQKGFTMMESFAWEKNRDGKWLAVFTRKVAPKEELQALRHAAKALTPALAFQVQRITEAVGSEDDRYWWTNCVQRLGEGAVDRALGLLREQKATGRVRNPGGLLTKIFKDIAVDANVALR